ncbi:uncharacterized protein LOC125501746 [Athalia rosae]|uniref:uncharacterized protein LOC125501746 n=1 Tax=Athalia rosae TaxID=37344 RepID=UPI0020345FE4|nr:uncharacterized protein LOC125501746 [Athalia rosae]
MGTAERTAFHAWYNKAVENNYVFEFDKELIDYCRSDVDILRRACSAFRDIFLTQGRVCPFSQSTTIASACSVLFRQNSLQDNTIGIIPSRGYRMTDNQSTKAVEWLVCEKREIGIEIMHAGRCREYRIPETGRPVDGYYVTEDGTRHVLEFRGCYWHGCRNCFTANRDEELVAKDCMNKRFEKTRAKTVRMRALGYVVTEMRECVFAEMLKNDAELRAYVEQHPLIVARNEKCLNPRDAFFGGRTNNTKRFYEVAEGERIRYVDVCSLYPWVCKNGRYPVGHPKVHVGDSCKTLTGPDNANLDAVEGLVKCVVLPPQNLYHPLLPVRMHGKLMFPLCRTCCENSTPDDCPHANGTDRWLSGTWVSDELKKAITLGYRIVDVNEIWQYDITSYDPTTKQGGLFVGYIDTFLKLKQEVSGWPAECDDETSRQRYVEEYERVGRIRLDGCKIAKNAGLRSVAKLCLNSFWGKFGQCDNPPRTKVINEQQRLFELSTDPDVGIHDILPVNERILHTRWGRTEKGAISLPNTNVVLAAYTTAQARLKLYSYLEKLQRRVLYFDTDSVIYVESENTRDKYKPPTGNFLGDLTDEVAAYGPGRPGWFGSSNTAVLHALCELSGPQRLALLRAADDNLVRNICECALNTLKGNVKLSDRQKSRLGRHRRILRRLASNRGSWRSKKKLLVQHGGFLPLLLAPIETVERLQRQRNGEDEAKETETEAQTQKPNTANTVSRLDCEMNDILALKGKSDREKWRLYSLVLNRYLYFAGETRKPLQLSIRDVSGRSR